MSLRTLTERIIQYIDQKNTQIDLEALLENYQGTHTGENWVYFRDNYLTPLNAGYYVYDLDMNHTMQYVSFNSYYHGDVEVKMLSFQYSNEGDGGFFPVLRKVTYYVRLDAQSENLGSSITYKLNTTQSRIKILKTHLLLKDRPRALMYTKLIPGDTNDRFVYLGTLLEENKFSYTDTDESYIQSRLPQVKPLNELSNLELCGTFTNGFTNPERSSEIVSSPSAPLTHLQTKIETDVKQMLDLE